jgi:hypothetical protein
MPASPAVAARDAEIFTKAEELDNPSRRAVAEAMGISRSRVQQAYTRRRKAEAAAAGTEPETEKAAPGGRPRKPLLEVALAVTIATWRASQGRSLPKAIRRALAPLKDRDGWQDELKAAVARARQPGPAQSSPESDRDIIDRLMFHLDEIEAELRGGQLSQAEAMRSRESALKFAERIERLRPAPERKGKREIDVAAIDGWAAGGHGKMKQAVVALQARIQETLGQCRQDGLMTTEAREVCRRLGHLPKESKDDEQGA